MIASTLEMTAPVVIKSDDEWLAQHVRRVIEAIDPLHPGERSVQVSVNGGVVTLEGIVASSAVKTQIMQAVCVAPGVQQVHDNLLVPFDLEFRVVQALASNARTSPFAARLGVSTIGSTVYLTGRLPSQALAYLVEVVAGKVRGVREVCSYLQVVPDEETNKAVTVTQRCRQ